MSRDSSRTYIHLHSPHHADLFEDFTTPSPSSTDPPSAQSQDPHNNLPPHTAPSNIPWSTTTPTNPSTLLAPTPLGNHPALPAEDILLPLHLLPPNPEDEDDIVPDQHAAFGISRVLTTGKREERGERWRDFGGLAERVRGLELGERGNQAQGASGRGATAVGRARERGR